MKHGGTDHQPYLIGLGWDIHRLPYMVGLVGPKRALGYLAVNIWKNRRRRSYWGIWQSEWSGCHRAVRGLTRDHTAGKSRRVKWQREQDRKEAAMTGSPAPVSEGGEREKR